jgi:hypothetical protein
MAVLLTVVAAIEVALVAADAVAGVSRAAVVVVTTPKD